MDILTEYKTMLGYKVSPEIAYSKIKDYFEKDFIGKDDEDDYWLALAYFQWKNGILIDEVKENALRCLEDNQYLERWAESGAKVLEKRKQTLAEFKYNLENIVNPTKKSFPKCPAYLRSKVPFNLGDIIAYKITKPIRSTGSDYYDKLEKASEKMCGKYIILKVVNIINEPVSQLCPDLDYSSSAVFMVYDWIGDEMISTKILDNLKYKKMCKWTILKEYDLDKMIKIDNPYLEKEMRPAFELDDINYLKIGDVCEIEVIGNDPSTDINTIDLWLEYPHSIQLNSNFDIIVAETFANFNYPEVWK